MKKLLKAALSRLLELVFGKINQPSIPVPDLDELRENEIQRSIRIEKARIEFEDLQRDRAKRLDEEK